MKKILVLVLAVAMMAVLAAPAFAAESVTISGAWWSVWTPAYEIADELELDIDVKGGDANWNNLVAIFSNVYTSGAKDPNVESAENGLAYKEYVVFRADSWGWGGGDNLSRDGGANVYTMGCEDGDGDGDIWNDFRAVMADAHIDAKFEKTADGIKMTYDVAGANGVSFTYVAETTVNVDEALYVFFTADASEITVTTVDAGQETAPQTGFAAVALAIAALGSGYVACKKH